MDFQNVLWSGAGAAVAGVVVGFGLSALREHFARKRRQRAHFSALRAEIDVCRSMAQTYLDDKVMAPLYRLPIVTYEQSLPQLLADGALEDGEVAPLIKFFNQVQTLNRGLDQVQELRGRGAGAEMRQEYDRNCLKARHLVDQHYPAAKSAFRAHLRRP